MKRKPINILLTGYGNLSKHIYNALKNKPEIKLAIDSVTKHKKKPEKFVPDIIWVLKKDDQIEKEIRRWYSIYPYALYISSSATFNIQEINRELPVRASTLYPPASFPGSRLRRDFSGITFLTEYGRYLMPAHRKMIKKIVCTLKARMDEIPYEERLRFHIAAVFANNFSHALWDISLRLVPPDCKKYLLPLMHQTLDNLRKMNPSGTITGPAKRNDRYSMNKHMELLGEKKIIKKIYRDISEYILQKFQNHDL